MGIRIDGASDIINASDGSLTIEGQSVNTSGMMTASGGLKIGTAATIHSTGQFNIGVAATIFASGNATFAGIVTAANLSIPANGDIRVANGTWSGEVAGKIQQNSNKLYIQGGSSGWQFRSSGGTGRWEIDGSGHITPVADSTYDIGTNSVRVRNFYADTLYGSGANLTGVSAGEFFGNSVGVSTSKNVGIHTTNVNTEKIVGAANSFVGLYMGDGFIGFPTSLNRDGGYFIATTVNALNAGPVSLGSTMTLHGTWTIV